MARRGFFDSTTASVDPVTGLPVGDNAEGSDFLADTLHTVLGNGVSMEPTSNLLVQTKTGLIVTLKAGKLWKNGYKLWETADRDITFTSSASVQTFYISGRLDVANNEFTHDEVYPYTTFVSSTDVCVAKIVIPANELTITDAMITDYRYNTTYCGVVDLYRTQLESIVEEGQDLITELETAISEVTVETLGAMPYDAASTNLLINGGFAVNQRAVSGTVTLASGAYGHDRWKAGASGCTYTFAKSENVTTLTISAGSLIQVVEGLNLQSGTVCLSWTGTAQGKIGAGSYSASGATRTATGGTNLNIEFNTGTLSKVQLNYGSVALPFVPRSYADELRLCQRYYLPITNASLCAATHYNGTPATQVFVPTPVSMRSTPTIIGSDKGLLYTPTGNIVPTSFSGASLKASGVIINIGESSMSGLGSMCMSWQSGSDNALDAEI